MAVQQSGRRGLLRRLYDWCIAAADKPHAMWIMGAVAFAESSFFPVPPDVMLIPMALARPQRAYVMAAWCTVASVAGGMLGYAIGALLYDSVGAWLIHSTATATRSKPSAPPMRSGAPGSSCSRASRRSPTRSSPSPPASVGYNFGLFVLFSIITRGARFFLLAFLLHRYGEQARHIIERQLGLWTLLFAVVLVGGIVAAVYLI